MQLLDGHFGADGAALEAVTRDAYLPRGTGLAGLAWQRGAAVLIDDLGQSGRFLRGDTVGPIGIKRGLSMPCSSRDGHHYVLNLLSASQAPIAERIECWAVTGDGNGLQRLFGFSESQGALPAGSEAPSLALSDRSNPIVAAWTRGVPQIADGDAAAETDGLLAIPVVASDGTVGEVVVLVF